MIKHGLAQTRYDVARGAKDVGKDTTEAMKGLAQDNKVVADKVRGWLKGIGDGVEDIGHYIKSQ